MQGKGPVLREGEVAFPAVPDGGEAQLRFIGIIHSPWHERSQCPKNVRIARESKGGQNIITVDPAYRLALRDLDEGQWIIVLSWLDQARRDLAIQTPKHFHSGPKSTFSLRSPVRPNPIGIHTVRILHLDMDEGRIEVDALDLLDETPLLDIKPFLPTVDIPPSAA